MSDNTYTPKSAMAILAHPDDIEFGCAGTVARWVKAGATIAYVLVTSGDVGIAEPGMTKAQAAEIRERESVAAAKVVGVEDVTFLRVPDGMVENNLALRKRLVREIRRFQPEVILTDDPTIVYTPRGGVNHPDHRAVGMGVLDAVFPASGQPNLFEELAEEGLTAHKVRKVYLQARGEGNEFVNITDTIDLKIEALMKHESQVGQMEGLADGIRDWTSKTGQGREMAYAEVFRLVVLEDDETWEKIQQAKQNQ
ncbi:MAG: PIG-L deacetylase family protein [Chloroflexota bacterium]